MHKVHDKEIAYLPGRSLFWNMKASGNLRKMRTQLGEPVQYTLHLNGEDIPMNDFVGKPIELLFTGQINCINCGRQTKKAFGQGFCYPCFMNSPMNSECIIRPELCEAHMGQGRDPEWEERMHNKPHCVYLALTSGVKVGVTRMDQIPTRWIDQGAWKTILVAETPYRQLAGEIEVFLKEFVSDKTHWQKMLKNVRNEEADLLEEKERLLDELPEDLGQYYSENDEVIEINFPVLTYPEKVKSMNFDKEPKVEGVLNGIRGQYLLFEGGRVINLRKFSGYFIDFSA